MSWAENEKLSEWIQRAYENGRKEELERIIKLLEVELGKLNAGELGSAWENLDYDSGFQAAIALIKGENK